MSNKPVNPQTVEEHLSVWWAETARRDAAKAIPKAVEYGAHDLAVIGSGMEPHAPQGQQIEAAIAFYLLGKAARLVGAYQEGRIPSVDSWDDSGVYAFMGRYVREFGRWP